jgi:hypothetical protein
MKRISAIIAILCIGLAIWAWSGVRVIEQTYTKKLVDGANDRAIQETLAIVGTEYFRNRVIGRIFFDSTTYDTGTFGNADTVIMVLKTYWPGGGYTTVDSSFKVGAFGLAINDTMDINEGRDTLFGERLVLIYRFADTLDAGVAATVGDTAKLSIRFQLQHGYQD